MSTPSGDGRRIPNKLIPSFGLRWNGTVLEQRFTDLGGGQAYWIPVPREDAEEREPDNR